MEPCRILLQKCREITAGGKTRVSEIYAEYAVDPTGHARLIACSGRIGSKKAFDASIKKGAA